MEIKEGYKIRYKMDEELSSTLIDSSGNDLNGVASLIEAEGYNKTKGRAVASQNQGFYRLNALRDNSRFTISTLYKLNDFSLNAVAYQTNILGLTNGSASGIFIGIKGDKELVISYYDGEHKTVRTGVFVNIGEWNCFVMVGENGTYKLYMNGFEVAKLVSSHDVGLNISSCYVNGSYNTGSIVFGAYDEVVLWEDALTSVDVYNIYRAYNKISKMIVANPHETEKFYSLSDKTLIYLPNNTEKTFFVYGINKNKEIQLSDLFNNINYVNENISTNKNGKTFIQDISEVNKLNIKEIK